MKKEYTIKKNTEMELIIRSKNRFGNSNFVIYKKTCEANKFRYAISIGKKYGNAVERNKMKRRIREVVSFEYSHFMHDVEVLIVVRPQSNQLTYEQIESQLKYLFQRNKLYEVNE